MIIRTYQLKDTIDFNRIYEQDYKDEFKIDHFFDNSIYKFTVVDDKSPVTIGTIKTLLETSALTDKSKSTRKRVDSLIETLNLAKHVADKAGHKELYVYVLDSSWEKLLKRYGFEEIKGKMLVYKV